MKATWLPPMKFCHAVITVGLIAVVPHSEIRVVRVVDVDFAAWIPASATRTGEILILGEIQSASLLVMFVSS